MKDRRQVLGWAFWTRWLIASLIGLGAGVFLWLAVGSGLEAVGIASASDGPGILIAGIIGLVFGAPFGAAQWIILRQYLRLAGLWVLATGLGYATVFLLGGIFFSQASTNELRPLQQIILGAVLGTGIAIPPAVLQWLMVLRQQVPVAGIWIPASAACWALGFAISFALRLTLGELTFTAGPVVSVALSGRVIQGLLRRQPLLL